MLRRKWRSIAETGLTLACGILAPGAFGRGDVLSAGEERELMMAGSIRRGIYRFLHWVNEEYYKECKCGECLHFLSAPGKKKQIEMCSLGYTAGFRSVRASDFVKCPDYEENTPAARARYLKKHRTGQGSRK